MEAKVKGINPGTCKIIGVLASQLGGILLLVSYILSKNNIGYEFAGLIGQTSLDNVLVSIKLIMIVVALFGTLFCIAKYKKKIVNNIAELLLFIVIVETIFSGGNIFLIISYVYNYVFLHMINKAIRIIH